MEIHLNKDLTHLDIYARGSECQQIFESPEDSLHVARIENPVLMTDLHAWGEFDPGLRDAILSLYMRPDRTVIYDGIQSHHHPDLYPRVWSANIDTLWLAQQMKTLLPQTETFLECGTGSGFITQFALYHSNSIQKAWATDINPYALKSLKDNCADPRVSAVLVDGDSIGVSERPDLVVCNPPYIPRPNAKVDNPYEGLKLIELLFNKGYSNLLMNISSTAGDLDLGSPVAEKLVPLKVNVVTNGISPASKDWISWLRENNRLVIRDDKQHGYRYWHYLRIYHITQ